ncbi:hypothetical protein [Nocardioides donggukensis]|uniref:Uncharacterized protein n=1 Tax=Nocardioides donggukensis TaxID=2774019 RepID=A0A927PZA9_9ACTN|nr:hypothetical protein [Nocardioides donggukensis]MBD8869863.1 hypothetical protein [Nocardioides donggukensis]
MSRILTRIPPALLAAGFLTLTLTGPATAIPDPGVPVGESGATVVREIEVPVDDGALELVQIGVGVAAGLALGAGAVAIGARRHQQDRSQGRTFSPA